MGNQWKVLVHESREELQHRLRYAVTATRKERVQMLYWIKTEAHATRQELSQRLGRNESTVYRWLQRYKEGGMEALLEVKTAPGKPAALPETVMNQRSERLEMPKGFKSYGEIQEWITQKCQVVVSYKTVHKIVRYKFNAKLKVPRPRSAQAKRKSKQLLKKTSRNNCSVITLCRELINKYDTGVKMKVA
jgi:transposase